MRQNSVYKRKKVEVKKQTSNILTEKVIIFRRRRRNKSGAKERRRKKEFITQPCIQFVAGRTLAKAAASHISQWTELLKRAKEQIVFEQIVFAFPGVVLFIFIFLFMHLV